MENATVLYTQAERSPNEVFRLEYEKYISPETNNASLEHKEKLTELSDLNVGSYCEA